MRINSNTFSAESDTSDAYTIVPSKTPITARDVLDAIKVSGVIRICSSPVVEVGAVGIAKYFVFS